MQQVCCRCGVRFMIAKQDQDFFLKLSSSALELNGVSFPTCCPDCRQQRRLVRRNERSFYKRSCDFCHQPILSMYPANAAFPVYCYSCWWSDRWDPLTFGRPYEPAQLFFDQFLVLQNAVPRLALFGKNNENCEYTNHTESSRSCYLCVDVAETQDTFYSKWMIVCRDCCDSYQLEKCELCYESQYSVGMHNNVYAFLSDRSSDLSFCFDCEGCSNCTLCAHLRHKHFCFQNEQLTEQEYRKRVEDLQLHTYSGFESALVRYRSLWKETFQRQHQVWVNAEQCSGDCQYNCKNVSNSYGVIESQDCAYCYDAGHMKDSQDAYEPAFHCELQYETHGCNRGTSIMACSVSYDVNQCAYCDTCHNSSHLFGCIGLRRKKHCILNIQYTENEYKKLVNIIRTAMIKEGSWGDFFPAQLSPFAYNESVAPEYYPLSKNEALSKGFRWKDKAEEVLANTKTIPANRLPDSIVDIPDDIVNWAIQCTISNRSFRITKQELDFYRKMRLPIPRLHPDERHRRRMAFTNPRRLWQRACAACSKEIESTFGPEREERVLCEECYLKEVY